MARHRRVRSNGFAVGVPLVSVTHLERPRQPPLVACLHLVVAEKVEVPEGGRRLA